MGIVMPGAAVHLVQQPGQVHGLIGEQRGQQDVVLPGRVRREQPGDLLGLLGGRRAIGEGGEPRPGCRQGDMLGDHLTDHARHVACAAAAG